MKQVSRKINWKKGQGLVPAIIQDADNGLVLMLAYMNKAALAKTLKSKRVWFYSRSRQRLWMKGESSRNVLRLVNLKLDCDNDTLLVKARPAGPVCHTGDLTCFKETDHKNTLRQLFNVIQDRKKKLPNNSYTAVLFKAGLDKIALKVVEESLEVIQAAQKETRKRLTEETVDLLYHVLVLLVDRKVSWSEIEAEVIKRRKH
jgi:phosphoribosyl-ATP pyrophosphohydrolase/phosphoribosyl-AMP cyclohydrolase